MAVEHLFDVCAKSNGLPCIAGREIHIIRLRCSDTNMLFLLEKADQVRLFRIILCSAQVNEASMPS
jgi:hypothetical protein